MTYRYVPIRTTLRSTTSIIRSTIRNIIRPAQYNNRRAKGVSGVGVGTTIILRITTFVSYFGPSTIILRSTTSITT